ncbi:MAG: hypothetical protein V4726_09585 [Verrucomicrobiota bacterium]
MSSSKNLITGYTDIAAVSSSRSTREVRQRTSREDRIFRSILPRSSASFGDFFLEPASDWGNQVLLEGDLLSPLNA